jgi:hypothetical protein
MVLILIANYGDNDMQKTTIATRDRDQHVISLAV